MEKIDVAFLYNKQLAARMSGQSCTPRERNKMRIVIRCYFVIRH